MIQTIKIGELVPNEGQIEGLPANPRTISDTQFEQLKKSLQETPEMLSYRELLVYPYGSQYVIIAGNMRYRAAVELGMDELPCKIIPTTTSIRKLREYAAKDNIEYGSWDVDILANEWDLGEMEDWGMDLSGIDWPREDEEEGEEVEEDDFSKQEAERTEARVRIGDIWQLGEHRLMCGDSTDAESVSRLMDGEKADMVFTDPPYGVAIGCKNKALNSVLPSGRCTENIANDNIPVNDLYPILVKAMTNCRENSKDCACYYVTSPQGGELGLMMMKDAGLPVRHMLIWEKNCATFSLGRLDYDYQHEPIFYTWTKSHKNYRKGEFRTTIWKYDKPRKSDLHPTMKPVGLVANCMKDATIEGDIVLDMFGGSGTTIMAAEQLGRKSRLMELSPHYCDVIIARWEKFTGKKAELING